jgi:hypothetical protein
MTSSSALGLPNRAQRGTAASLSTAEDAWAAVPPYPTPRKGYKGWASSLVRCRSCAAMATEGLNTAAASPAGTQTPGRWAHDFGGSCNSSQAGGWGPRPPPGLLLP